MEDTLTILAPGSRLRSDIETYGIVGDVMAVNRAIADYPGNIKYAVGVWEEYIDAMLNVRRLSCRNHEDVTKYTRQINEWFYVNNSGLLALSLAKSMKYKHVRVLGMHMDRSGHYYDILPDVTEYDKRFTFGVPECEDILPTWTHFRTSPGNLEKYFKIL